MRRDPDFLFSDFDLRASMEAQGQKLIEEIDSIDTNRLLNTNPDELINYFEQKYYINAPNLMNRIFKLTKLRRKLMSAAITIDS